jgi:H+-transporting ATPase
MEMTGQARAVQFQNSLLRNEIIPDKDPAAAASPLPKGMTTSQANRFIEQYGKNEVPVVQKTILQLLTAQFVGTMPFILEACVIISAAVADWADFGVIFVMLIMNALIGLNEQLKARRELSKLTDTMISTISVSRDGADTMLPVTDLVPGDVILVQGGNMIPADVEWVQGDVLMIDTAALTGEPIPRKYPSKEHGTMILSGCTVKAGEVSFHFKKHIHVS